MVRAKGLEPPRLSSPEPKSGASTNSATPAVYNKVIKTASLYTNYCLCQLYRSVVALCNFNKKIAVVCYLIKFFNFDEALIFLVSEYSS